MHHLLLEMERNKKKLVETLTRGKNSAKRLQDILHQKVNDDGLVSVDDLVTEISESFYGGLLVLSPCNSVDLCRVPVSPRLPEVCSGEKPVTTVKEHRRGCYKRRKTKDSRTEISGTIEDGYAWRKYGQKEILNSKFPRCYFRCTQKHVHGCKALKQVQKMEDESNMFHITYFGYHTCLSTPNTFSHPSIPSIITDFHFDPSLKKEDVCDDISLANEQSSHALVWSDILIDDCESFKNDGILSDVSIG